LAFDDPCAQASVQQNAGAVDTAALALEVDYFDGQHPVRQVVQVSVQAQALVVMQGVQLVLRVALAEVHWPHHQRHGARMVSLPNGATLHARDAQAWDAWAWGALRLRDRVGQWQTKAGLVLVAVVLLLALAWATYRWILPAGAQWLAHRLPPSVEATVGAQALQELESHVLKPSALSSEDQAVWRQRFAQATARWQTAKRLPPVAYDLRFYRGAALGPNALALPGGVVIVTDELLDMLSGHDEVVLGVLAHELTHVRERHGVRGLIQASVLGVVVSALTGDFSAVVTTAATVVGASDYSRDFEREADQGAIDFLLANGWSPARMRLLFERLSQVRQDESGWGIAFASHPSDASRVAVFESAGQQPKE
jgi:Zn-dependent protease with chaperone function